MSPYFVEDENVNSENCRNMVINYAFPRFASSREDYIWHQDGAPLHSSNRVRNYLILKGPNNWIRREGPVEWLSQSSYLSPCDFCLWVHIKGKVFNTPVTSIRDLKTRIIRESRRISPVILESLE